MWISFQVSGRQADIYIILDINSYIYVFELLHCTRVPLRVLSPELFVVYKY